MTGTTGRDLVGHGGADQRDHRPWHGSTANGTADVDAIGLGGAGVGTFGPTGITGKGKAITVTGFSLTGNGTFPRLHADPADGLNGDITQRR